MNNKMLCRLCLKPCNTSVEKIEEITVEMLEVLFIKLDVDTTRPVMCENCSEDLHKFFDFKSKCLYMEDAILPYINCNKQLDIKDIYFKINTNLKVTNISRFQRICRLCIKLTKKDSFTLLNAEKGDMDAVNMTLKNYLPEVNINATKKPGFCSSCVNSLTSFSAFIENCLSVQEKNKSTGTASTSSEEQDDPNSGQQVSLESECTADAAGMPTKTKATSKTTKNATEVVENVVSEDDENVETDAGASMNVDDQTCSIKQEEVDIKSESSEENAPKSTRKKYKKRRHPNRKLLQCYHCPYSTLKLSYLKKHLIIHRDPSRSKMYKCEKCPFESKHQCSFTKHLRRHVDPSERIIYPCKICSFKSTRLDVYRRHMRCHEDPSRVFKCTECDYETMDKKSFNYHTLNHKSASEVTMLKCDECDFKSRHKQSIKAHMVTHKEVPANFHCDVCDFKTTTKDRLRRHMVTHKDPSELKMFGCEVCAYQTKYRYALKSHMVIHKSDAEVVMYQCDFCTFESKRKASVKNHMLTHIKNMVIAPMSHFLVSPDAVGKKSLQSS